MANEEKEGRGLFGKLKEGIEDLIYEDAETADDSDGETKPVRKSTIDVSKLTQRRPSDVQESAQPGVEIDPKILERLQDEVFKGNTDFIQFLANLQVLEDVLVDPAQRYQAAFKTTRASKKEILDSAMIHMDLLNDEHVKFDREADQQREEKVGTKEERLLAISSETGQLTAQIEELEKQILALREEDARIRQEITSETENIESTKQAFATAADSVEAELKHHIDSVTRFIADA